MKTTTFLTTSVLSLTLLLSACQNQQLAPATSSPQPSTPAPVQSIDTSSPLVNASIAPLPKGPRQPVASSSPNLAIARRDFSPIFPSAAPLASPSAGFGPGTAGHGSIIPFPSATSDISVVERSVFNGKIFDTAHKPIDGATVTARSLNPSVPYQASSTSLGGAYAFNNAPAGVQIEIIVSVPNQPAQRRVEVIKSNKEGNPNANRYDFGTDGSNSSFGSNEQAIGAPGTTTAPSPAPTPVPSPTPGLLTAGSWRDLDHWEYWLNLMQNPSWSQMMTYWGLSPLHRLGVRVKQGDQPVVDAPLVLKDADGKLIAEARSDNQGQAEFFAGLTQTQPGPFSISSADQQHPASLDQIYPQHQAYELTFSSSVLAPQNVDLMLVMDTTGSMGDELDYLKSELHNVFNRVRQDNTQLQLRASMNFYRDQWDEYLIRDFAFTSDLSQSQAQLSAQSADGGGDYPEAVSEALENALKAHDWSSSARTRLLLLVLDAPPHNNAQNLEKLRALIPLAQKLGVRIVPIASSGIDKQSEFLLRMLAITTGGEYVFLTDDSGIGGSHIEPTIGEHKVEKLNALLLELIKKYTR